MGRKRKLKSTPAARKKKAKLTTEESSIPVSESNVLASEPIEIKVSGKKGATKRKRGPKKRKQNKKKKLEVLSEEDVNQEEEDVNQEEEELQDSILEKNIEDIVLDENIQELSVIYQNTPRDFKYYGAPRIQSLKQEVPRKEWFLPRTHLMHVDSIIMSEFLEEKNLPKHERKVLYHMLYFIHGYVKEVMEGTMEFYRHRTNNPEDPISENDVKMGIQQYHKRHCRTLSRKEIIARIEKTGHSREVRPIPPPEEIQRRLAVKQEEFIAKQKEKERRRHIVDEDYPARPIKFTQEAPVTSTLFPQKNPFVSIFESGMISPLDLLSEMTNSSSRNSLFSAFEGKMVSSFELLFNEEICPTEETPDESTQKTNVDSSESTNSDVSVCQGKMVTAFDLLAKCRQFTQEIPVTESHSSSKHSAVSAFEGKVSSPLDLLMKDVHHSTRETPDKPTQSTSKNSSVSAFQGRMISYLDLLISENLNSKDIEEEVLKNKYVDINLIAPRPSTIPTEEDDLTNTLNLAESVSSHPSPFENKHLNMNLITPLSQLSDMPSIPSPVYARPSTISTEEYENNHTYAGNIPVRSYQESHFNRNLITPLSQMSDTPGMYSSIYAAPPVMLPPVIGVEHYSKNIPTVINAYERLPVNSNLNMDIRLTPVPFTSNFIDSSNIPIIDVKDSDLRFPDATNSCERLSQDDISMPIPAPYVPLRVASTNVVQSSSVPILGLVNSQDISLPTHVPQLPIGVASSNVIRPSSVPILRVMNSQDISMPIPAPQVPNLLGIAPTNVIQLSGMPIPGVANSQDICIPPPVFKVPFNVASSVNVMQPSSMHILGAMDSQEDISIPRPNFKVPLRVNSQAISMPPPSFKVPSGVNSQDDINMLSFDPQAPSLLELESSANVIRPYSVPVHQVVNNEVKLPNPANSFEQLFEDDYN